MVVRRIRGPGDLQASAETFPQILAVIINVIARENLGEDTVASPAPGAPGPSSPGTREGVLGALRSLGKWVSERGQ